MSVARSYSGPDSDLQPDAAVIRAFIEWWFEKCTRGVLEIGWMDADGRGLIHFEQFERNDISALVATAVQANLVPGQSMYFRASTVMSWASGPHRTTDMDAEQAPGIWSDIDTLEDFEHARTVETIVRPTASVITGNVPHPRVQSWFKCSEPIPSPELVRALNRRLHRLYGGDPSVVNPSRLMRLPGLIAWPLKEGRVPEVVQFVRPGPDDNRPVSYPLALLTSQLPQLEEQQQERPQKQTDGPAGPFGFAPSGAQTVSWLINEIRMGRQWHNRMIELVAHWVGVGRSSVEILATAEHLTLAGYTATDTRAEMAKAIEGARRKWGVPDVDPVLDSAHPKRPNILSLADLDALPPPTWLVHGLVPEKCLIVPYGPPKAGKTFVMLSLGLHVAANRSWFGYPVQGGAVVYIAGEGVGGLSTRLKAMRAKYEIAADIPFWVIPRAVNFRVPAEVNALEATIKETIGTTPMRLLFVDTLARAMPGADENSAQEVGAVIAAADYLKEELRCTVALVHHEGKDGDRGARGTSALRGAWDAAYQITGSKGRAKLIVVDQKDAEAGQTLSFIMEEVPVGIGRTSLVPVLDDSPDPEPATRRALGRQAEIALRTLRDLMAGPESAILPPFSGLPAGDVRGVNHEMFRRVFYEKMPDSDQQARKVAFRRCVEILIQREMIGVKDPWVWLV